MDHQVPQGFRLAGVHCGVKSKADRPDLTLIVSDEPAVAAGVYTQNRIVAAPVLVDRQRTPSDAIRVVVANSGNANACTGARGLRDALQMGELAAEACQAQAQQSLVLSTGIIGEYLPMEKIATGVRAAATQLGAAAQHALQAARGIMTTDRFEKIVSRQTGGVRLLGMAKGAGMIGPRMATMLGILLTDARLTAAEAQQLLEQAVASSFNCISVEGHMSTNDTVLLLASGKAGPLDPPQRAAFADTLTEACEALARMIPTDGEGASHLITIDVLGCATAEDARRIAETVANSALVKTAVAGNDPNWGRIVSAAGYAGVPFDPAAITLHLNGHLLFQHGAPTPFDPQQVSHAIRDNQETRIRLALSEGDHQIRFWTSDLTVDYVTLNADYHT